MQTFAKGQDVPFDVILIDRTLKHGRSLRVNYFGLRMECRYLERLNEESGVSRGTYSSSNGLASDHEVGRSGGVGQSAILNHRDICNQYGNSR
jgi:hypothetical protein